MIRDLVAKFPVLRLTAAVLAATCLLGLVLAQDGKDAKKPAAAANKYIGADKCKNCHKAEESGNQFGHWQESGHAKAFATLASDEAKRIAKEKGIADPQKADECLRCHATAFGEPAEHIKKGFDGTLGVQCETCHGPGDNHMKARMAAAAKAAGGDGFGDEGAKAPQKLPDGEILLSVGFDNCKRCHNAESPTFKPFCYCMRSATIRHLDPRKGRTEADVMQCACEANCPCEHGERTDGKPCCVPGKG